MTFGKRLYELRRQKGLSQEELGDTINVSRQTVSKWETDQTYPDFDKLEPLAKLFGITIDELVSGSSDENSKVYFIQEEDSGYEYKSKASIFGLPLIHVNVCNGFRHKRRVAKGIIAIGNTSYGLISIGLISVGIFSIGIISIGVLALGIATLAILSFGVIATGFLTTGFISLGIYAVGVVSVGAKVSVGALSFGSRPIDVAFLSYLNLYPGTNLSREYRIAEIVGDSYKLLKPIYDYIGWWIRLLYY